MDLHVKLAQCQDELPAASTSPRLAVLPLVPSSGLPTITPGSSVLDAESRPMLMACWRGWDQSRCLTWQSLRVQRAGREGQEVEVLGFRAEWPQYVLLGHWLHRNRMCSFQLRGGAVFKETDAMESPWQSCSRDVGFPRVGVLGVDVEDTS